MSEEHRGRMGRKPTLGLIRQGTVSFVGLRQQTDGHRNTVTTRDLSPPCPIAPHPCAWNRDTQARKSVQKLRTGGFSCLPAVTSRPGT